MIHSLVAAIQQPWYALIALSFMGLMCGLLMDRPEVKKDPIGSLFVFIVSGIAWPITAGVLVGSLAQRWLK